MLEVSHNFKEKLNFIRLSATSTKKYELLYDWRNLVILLAYIPCTDLE